jgi:hypothetical protein
VSPAWIVPLFPFLFVGMWLAVLNVLSSLGGWRRLANHYPAPPLVTGQLFSWRTGRLGWVNYSSCLNLTAGPSGLLIATSAPFRFAHTPLFVPWGDVTAERTRRFFFAVVKLHFRRVPDAVLELPAGLAARLATASQDDRLLRDAG